MFGCELPEEREVVEAEGELTVRRCPRLGLAKQSDSRFPGVQEEVREAAVGTPPPLSINPPVYSVFYEWATVKDPLRDVEVHHRDDLPPGSLGDEALDNEASTLGEFAQALRCVVPVTGEPPRRVRHSRPQIGRRGREVERTPRRENAGNLADRLRLATRRQMLEDF